VNIFVASRQQLACDFSNNRLVCTAKGVLLKLNYACICNGGLRLDYSVVYLILMTATTTTTAATTTAVGVGWSGYTISTGQGHEA
jgi:hypothetical protein